MRNGAEEAPIEPSARVRNSAAGPGVDLDSNKAGLSRRLGLRVRMVQGKSKEGVLNEAVEDKEK